MGCQGSLQKTKNPSKKKDGQEEEEKDEDIWILKNTDIEKDLKEMEEEIKVSEKDLARKKVWMTGWDNTIKVYTEKNP